MNKQNSEPVDHPAALATGNSARRRVPKNEAVRRAWHQAGLDMDFGVLILSKPVKSKRPATDPDADDAIHKEAG